MRSPWRFIVLAVVLVAAAMLLDQWTYHHINDSAVYDHGAGRMFRTVGFWPFWLIAAAALALSGAGARIAWLLAIVPGVSGLVGELLKMLIRRERPGLHDGAYYFRPFRDQLFSTSHFGLPSSEVMVAFGAGWLLCRIYPRAWPVWLGLAAGCGVTRLMVQAHFLSDVTTGAVAAWAVVALMWRAWGSARPSVDTAPAS